MSLVVAAGGSKALWFATRGAGTVAFLALTATVVLGIAGVQRLRTERLPRFVVAGLHRNLTLLALALLAVHIGTTVVDTYAPVSLRDAVVPFVSAYRPLWLGLGALAFDLLLALTVTSLLRVRIGFRRWKALHWLAYVSWPVALLHALGTGSDARVGWMRLLAVASVLAVGAAVFVRLGRPSAYTPARLTVAGAVLVLPLLGAGWYASGPARHGWAARAGTPATLVAPQVPTRRLARRPPAAPPALPAAPFSAHFAGTLRQSGAGNGLVLVNIAGRTSGGADGRLWIRLQGQPTEDGGVSMTASGASFGPPSWPNAYVGRITELEGTRVGLTLHGRSRSLHLVVDLAIDQSSNSVSGSVRADPAVTE